MYDALGSSLVKKAGCLVSCNLCVLKLACLNSSANCLNSSLKLGTDSLVALACLLSGENTLLLRLDVSHVRFLSVFTM